MKYELMFPDQIENAIDAGWPAVLPVGVLEYHASHLAVGVDTVVVARALEKYEQQNNDIIIFPAFYYGAASYAVAPPERKGTIDISAGTLRLFARELSWNLLRIGFRNIHVFITHQSENFVQGMPTDLSFKLGAREAIFNFMEKTAGEGWWGNENMQDYYARHARGEDPFSWIQVHPLRGPEARKECAGDHSGKMETSVMMNLCPEGVDMERFSGNQWYSREAAEADAGFGEKIVGMILAHIEKCLRGED